MPGKVAYFSFVNNFHYPMVQTSELNKFKKKPNNNDLVIPITKVNAFNNILYPIVQTSELNKFTK